MNNPLTRGVTAATLGVSLVIALAQTLEAHHLPGEGFTAGALLLIALLVSFVLLGRERPVAPVPLRSTNVLLVTGLLGLSLLLWLPLASGKTPLQVLELELGPLQLSSTVLFDLSILLLIVGGALMALVRHLPSTIGTLLEEEEPSVEHRRTGGDEAADGPAGAGAADPGPDEGGRRGGDS